MELPADHVYRLPLSAANVYLLEDEDGWTLVDAGTPWDTREVRRLLWDAGIRPGDLTRVLLTHYDVDHVGTLADLAPDLRCPVYVARPDRDYLLGDDRPPLASKKGLVQRLAGRFLDVPDVEARTVVDGDEIGGFRAVHTPGHTPGHTAYLHGEYGVAFLGDLVRSDGRRLDVLPAPIADDAGQNARSIHRLLDAVPSFDVAAVGHGDPVRTGGRDALEALASRL